MTLFGNVVIVMLMAIVVVGVPRSMSGFGPSCAYVSFVVLGLIAHITASRGSRHHGGDDTLGMAGCVCGGACYTAFVLGGFALRGEKRDVGVLYVSKHGRGMRSFQISVNKRWRLRSYPVPLPGGRRNVKRGQIRA